MLASNDYNIFNYNKKYDNNKVAEYFMKLNKVVLKVNHILKGSNKDFFNQIALIGGLKFKIKIY